MTFYKQFRHRSGPSKRQAWSESKRFDTLMIFLKEIFEKEVDFEKKNQQYFVLEHMGTYHFFPQVGASEVVVATGLVGALGVGALGVVALGVVAFALEVVALGVVFCGVHPPFSLL